METRQAQAESRRAEFRSWLLQKARSKRVAPRAIEERYSRTRHQLQQEKLESADAKRTLQLADVSSRAATSSTRREEAVLRLEKRRELRSTRLEDAFCAAQGRRLALQDADKERLRKEHELVMVRLALSQDKDKDADQGRKLQERLAAAEENRLARLADLSARAASKFSHAKSVNHLNKLLQLQGVVERSARLATKLSEAAERRESLQSPKLSSPTKTPVSRTVAAPTGGVAALGAAAAAAAAGSAAGSGQVTGDTGEGPSRTPPHQLDWLKCEYPELPRHGTELPEQQLSTPTSAAGSVAQPFPSPAELVTSISSAAATEAANMVETGRGQSASRVPATEHQGAGGDRGEAAEERSQLHLERVELFRRHVSSKRVQACWRSFRAKKRTTAALATDFVDTGITDIELVAGTAAHVGGHLAASNRPTSAARAIPGARSHAPPPLVIEQQPPPAVFVGGMGSPSSPRTPGPGEMEFEQFAATLRAPHTLRATQSLLRRLEARLHICNATPPSCSRLLHRLFPGVAASKGIDRYPQRIFLCAYMILKHPEIVFNQSGDRESQLAASAAKMIARFESLLQRITHPTAAPAPDTAQDLNRSSNSSLLDYLAASPVARGVQAYHRARRAAASAGSLDSLTAELAAADGGQGAAASGAAGAATSADLASDAAGSAADMGAHIRSIGGCLVRFDEAWLHYLDQFAAWKGEDAAGMEAELVRMSVEMEKSMRRKMRGRPNMGERGRSAADLEAVIEQVHHDHSLLRERILKLSGPAGGARLDVALEAGRSLVASESESELSTTDGEGERSPRRPMLPRTPPPPVQQPAHAPSGIRRGFFPAASHRAPSATVAVATSTTAAAAAAAPAPAVLHAAQGPPAEVQSNSQLVYELIHNPKHQLSDEDAVGAWRRAGGFAIDSPDSAARGTHPAGRGAGGGERTDSGLMRMRYDANEASLQPMDEADVGLLEPGELLRRVRDRAKVMTERVFWDGVVLQLCEGLMQGALLRAVTPMVAELGVEIMAALSGTQQAAALRADFSEQALTAALDGSAAGSGDTTAAAVVQRLMAALARIALLLVQCGSAGREDDALAAHRAVKQQLVSAFTAFLTSPAPPPTSTPIDAAASPSPETPTAPAQRLACAIARALRLLFAQLKLLKLDTANSRLAMLSRQIQGPGAVSYLQARFASQHQLPPAQLQQGPLLQPLPRTRAWLDGAGPALAAMTDFLATEGLQMRERTATALSRTMGGSETRAGRSSGGGAVSNVPANLRTGLRGASGSQAAEAAGPLGPSTGPLVAPVQLGSWRAWVRAGVVELIAGTTPAISRALPETLAWDVERLHAAQNKFQHVAVVTTGLKIIAQFRSLGTPGAAPALASPTSPTPTSSNFWSLQDRQSAHRRLSIVLSSPDMRLADLVTLLTSLAGSHATTDLAVEDAIRSAFLSAVDPAGLQFRSLSVALKSTVLAALLLGEHEIQAQGGVPDAGVPALPCGCKRCIRGAAGPRAQPGRAAVSA
ncbi:MAG: hypothetical protein WDW38_011580 [Sanguina aurantia]